MILYDRMIPQDVDDLSRATCEALHRELTGVLAGMCSYICETNPDMPDFRPHWPSTGPRETGAALFRENIWQEVREDALQHGFLA